MERRESDLAWFLRTRHAEELKFADRKALDEGRVLEVAARIHASLGKQARVQVAVGALWLALAALQLWADNPWLALLHLLVAAIPFALAHWMRRRARASFRLVHEALEGGSADGEGEH